MIQQCFSDDNMKIKNLNEQQNNHDKTIKVNEKKFQYRKMIWFKIANGYNVKFEFNTSITLMFVSISAQIQVFGFNSKNKLISTFNNKVEIKCLAWIKKSNSLVLEGEDYTIVIQQNYWNTFQKLQGHSGSISALVVTKNEALLISGSDDETIKFWKNINQSWSCWQSLNVGIRVSNLSINTSEKKLISSFSFPLSSIRVIEYLYDSQWTYTQYIHAPEQRLNLHFIHENQFIYQPSSQNYIVIYEYDQEKQYFKKQNKIYFSLIGGRFDSCDGFKCQFASEKNLLILKSNGFLHIIYINKNGDYVVQQQIQHENNLFSGKQTANGEYFILNARNQIQVWKLQCLQ